RRGGHLVPPVGPRGGWPRIPFARLVSPAGFDQDAIRVNECFQGCVCHDGICVMSLPRKSRMSFFLVAVSARRSICGRASKRTFSRLRLIRYRIGITIANSLIVPGTEDTQLWLAAPWMIRPIPVNAMLARMAI